MVVIVDCSFGHFDYDCVPTESNKGLILVDSFLDFDSLSICQ